MHNRKNLSRAFGANSLRTKVFFGASNNSAPPGAMKQRIQGSHTPASQVHGHCHTSHSAVFCVALPLLGGGGGGWTHPPIRTPEKEPGEGGCHEQ